MRKTEINKLISQIDAKLKLPFMLEKEAHTVLKHLKVGFHLVWLGCQR